MVIIGENERVERTESVEREKIRVLEEDCKVENEERKRELF